MRILTKLERLIGSTLEGTSSSLFRQKLSPVDLESRLEDAMVDNSRPSRGGRIAPNSYLVTMNPDTYESSFGSMAGLDRHCAHVLNNIAARKGYTLLHPRIAVSFDTNGSLGRRDIDVQASFDAPAAEERMVPPAPVHRPPAEHTRVFTPPPATTPWYLVVVTGDLAGERFPIREGVTTLGRGGDNDIALHDQHVSRRHAIVERHGNALEIRDIGSSNGTDVNGHKVPEAVLRAGDLVTLANVTLRLDYVEPGW